MLNALNFNTEHLGAPLDSILKQKVWGRWQWTSCGIFQLICCVCLVLYLWYLPWFSKFYRAVSTFRRWHSLWWITRGPVLRILFAIIKEKLFLRTNIAFIIVEFQNFWNKSGLHLAALHNLDNVNRLFFPHVDTLGGHIVSNFVGIDNRCLIKETTIVL